MGGEVRGDKPRGSVFFKGLFLDEAGGEGDEPEVHLDEVRLLQREPDSEAEARALEDGDRDPQDQLYVKGPAKLAAGPVLHDAPTQLQEIAVTHPVDMPQIMA